MRISAAVALLVVTALVAGCGQLRADRMIPEAERRTFAVEIITAFVEGDSEAASELVGERVPEETLSEFRQNLTSRRNPQPVSSVTLEPEYTDENGTMYCVMVIETDAGENIAALTPAGAPPRILITADGGRLGVGLVE